MQIGIYGLGRMGANMARRLLRAQHKVVVFNRSPKKTKLLGREGATPTYSLDEFVNKLKTPRALWVMLPSGKVTDQALEELKNKLTPGDIIVEGGNSYFRDSQARAKRLEANGLHYLDVGTSGGIWGLKIGYCLMIGGERAAFEKLKPIFKTLAPKDGFLYCGAAGAGHFVKMIHNGIEYGLMQAYGEGFQMLHSAPFKLDLKKIARLWNHGSVVRSWLLELAENALSREGNDLKNLKGFVEDSGEGRWTILEAVHQGVPASALALSLFARFLSRDKDAFANKLIAGLRNQFGGHEVKRKNSP